MWIVGIKTKFKQVLLEQVQRLSFLMVTGATRTTPTAGMEAILRLPPIDILLQEQAIRIWRGLIRSNAISYRNLNHDHVGWIRSHTRLIPLIKIPVPLVTKTNIGSKQHLCTIVTRTEWEKGECSVKQVGITCFTDGSLQKNVDDEGYRTGCGVVIITHEPRQKVKANCFYLGSITTVYDCEMEGIRRAA